MQKSILIADHATLGMYILNEDELSLFAHSPCKIMGVYPDTYYFYRELAYESGAGQRVMPSIRQNLQYLPPHV